MNFKAIIAVVLFFAIIVLVCFFQINTVRTIASDEFKMGSDDFPDDTTYLKLMEVYISNGYLPPVEPAYAVTSSDKYMCGWEEARRNRVWVDYVKNKRMDNVTQAKCNKILLERGNGV